MTKVALLLWRNAYINFSFGAFDWLTQAKMIPLERSNKCLCALC